MKKEIRQFLFLTLAVIFAMNSISAQETGKEKKSERKITIVTVDENGVKKEIDTVITDQGTMKKVFITETGDHMKWTVLDDSAMTGKEKSFTFIIKEGDGVYSISANDSLEWIDEDGKNIILKDGALIMSAEKGMEKSARSALYVTTKGEKGKNVFVTVDEDTDRGDMHIISKGDKLVDGETEIIIRSADGVENFRIKGDAVITIKDGSVKVENRSSGLKEVVEEKQVKKVNKK